MSRFSQQIKRLGISGLAFAVLLALFLVSYLTGNPGLTILCGIVLVPLTAFVLFRVMRWVQHHALWSVRNRLLFVYCLLGILPLLLLLTLVGLGAWSFFVELAFYLANSALERRIDSINNVAVVLSNMTPQQRLIYASDFQKGVSRDLPGFRLYITDETGNHKYPADSPDLPIAATWGNTSGLLVIDHKFYGWSHVSGATRQITALAPLAHRMVADLVPNLGIISLIEESHQANTSQHFLEEDPAPFTLPPATSRFDLPLEWFTSLNHAHLDKPNQKFSGVLFIKSRPSAVFNALLSGTSSVTETFSSFIVIVTVLFVLVEAGAIWVGVRLATRLTGSVNQLYEGTWRVIRGDFRHRIPGNKEDQLGELANSFNQMTGNLERLLAVEKEKERLQTEIEIAREVQSQLYPKEAPPMRGLKLTVLCDPARMVSGDYYDYTEVGDHQLAFAIGDVAGKGISAALLMATLQAALRSQVAHAEATRTCMQSAAVISQLNKQIWAHTAPEKYATFFFATFDAPSRTLTYTNAGHLSPLLLRNGEFTPLDSNGTVVGAFPFAEYDSSKMVIQPDDLLVCYTDGITEPENAYGEAFGEERLMDLVKKHCRQPDMEIVQIVMDAVRSWTGTAELFDDMTLLLARGVQWP